jgi:hypothetical protein
MLHKGFDRKGSVAKEQVSGGQCQGNFSFGLEVEAPAKSRRSGRT